MGLDIYCNGKCETVGSYSNVHCNRYVLILSGIYYLEKYIENMKAQQINCKTTIEKLQNENCELEKKLESLNYKDCFEECCNIEDEMSKNNQNVFNNEMDIHIYNTEEQIANEAIKHLKKISTKKEIERQYNIGNTISTIKSTSYIDYAYLQENWIKIVSTMINFNLDGVLYWVNHSDCEGIFKPKQCKKLLHYIKVVISEALNGFKRDRQDNQDRHSLFMYLYKIDNKDVTHDNYTDFTPEQLYKAYYLYDVLNESVESGKLVHFG
jgi:hypothetical protein